MDDEQNTMKILISSDNHIGYMEKDPVRCNDSMESFEEVLRIAKEQEVDFILLGGDLFHENKPSRMVLHHTMELLRHYCMGSRPCPIEFRSDQSVNFQHSKFPVVNYEDPNYNVSIPVFTIHGNHDDPAGEGNLSAVDILSVANLVNYFGKAVNIESIEVSPLLLQKGTTRLALYGLGSCRDERLHRMFRKGRVKFLRPSEEEGDWFNVLVLHQNRAKHGATNYIPTSFIPEFFDLVLWGHEHECLIEPEYVHQGVMDESGEEKGVYISQPGSSVATSLSDGEMKKKNVGVLYIRPDCTFKIDPIPLTTVRPFVMEAVCLKKTGIPPEEEEKVSAYLTQKVKDMIDKAAADNEGCEKLPLVRLKVDYSGGYNTFSLARFGQKFVDHVANPRTILLWHQHRQPTTLRKKEEEGEDLISGANLRTLESSDVASLLVEQLKEEKLTLLSEKNLAEALTEFVDKEEKEAISDFVKYSLQQSQDYLKHRPITETDIDSQISQQREELLKRQEAAADEARAHLASVRESLPDRTDGFDDHNSSDSDDNPKETTQRGRGGGRGRRGRGATSAGRGRGRGRGAGEKGKSTRGTSKKKTASAATPSLSFTTTTTTTTAHTSKATSRHTGKRAVVYGDESDSDEEVQFLPKKKKKSVSDSPYTVASEVVDLTQGDDSDSPSDPFSGFSTRPPSKRRKH